MLETVKHTEEAEKFHLAFLKMLLGREFYFFHHIFNLLL